MNSFKAKLVENQLITPKLMRIIGEIREYKGKQELYKNQSPQVLNNLIEVATIQSTESSNRIEGVIAPHKRIVDLVREKTTPKNRPEEEILGYRYVLNLIHQNHKHIPFTPNIICQLHGDLYRYASVSSGKWKTTDNTIEEIRADGTRVVRFQPVPAYRTNEYMRGLHDQYNQRLKEGELENLLLIATYILDFLCIHPFLDGNGRVSRLITLMLLYHNSYEVGRYISIEKIIEETKESYYEALQKSSEGWHECKHVLSPWWEYFLTTILIAYREFEKRIGLISQTRGSKTALVVDTIDQIRGEFTIQYIMEKCPTVGIDWIRKILRQLKDANKIECLGRGPNARWRKI